MLNNKFGFTIIELMVTVGIFGVLASLAAPSINDWFRSMSAQAQASSIIAGINKARSEAISRNNSIVMYITSDGAWQYGCLNVNTDTNSGAYCPTDILEQNSESTGSGNLTYTITPSGGNYILFNSLGVSTTNTTAGTQNIESIELDAGLKKYEIKIRSSGIAKLCEGACS